MRYSINEHTPARTHAMPWREFGRLLLITALGNTLIAGLLVGLGVHDDFATVWIGAQCIGFACLLSSRALARLLPASGRPLSLVLTPLVGLPIGVWLAFLAGVPIGGPDIESIASGAARYLLFCFVVTLAYHYYFSSRHRLRQSEDARREAELREANVQKTALRAHLSALQAQIEPHFLFNTLANLHSLIGRDDTAARSLLESLDGYLRATLTHSRAERATLGDECAVLAAYLAIQSQRMGARLTWRIDVADGLRAHAFPPMLLQPLVENALLHGVEPCVEGGRIVIAARQQDGCLCLSVTDDGPGFDAAAGEGVGLANVRERLAALFGAPARLTLTARTPRGVIAELWIPQDSPAS
ncbi:MAG: histidine kinase [Rhodocyclaceae bacterium]